MTAKPDGLSWTALATIAGFFGLLIMVYSLIHAGINKHIDDLRAEIAAVSADVESVKTDVDRVKTDVSDLKADMAVVLAVLERIERRQIADDGRQLSPAGTTLARPLPVSFWDGLRAVPSVAVVPSSGAASGLGKTSRGQRAEPHQSFLSAVVAFKLAAAAQREAGPSLPAA